jgi:hypothetical protein
MLQHPTIWTRNARASASFSMVSFYGLKYFWCKTAQFCATQSESEIAETSSVRNGAQRRENPRNNCFLN